jgi:hypothetical protein
MLRPLPDETEASLVNVRRDRRFRPGEETKRSLRS